MKWLSGKALQIAVKRKEVKSKGEKERYKHLNAEFQRIARRDSKNTQKSYTKNDPDIHDPDNHNGEITHLELDILECKIKWALGSITMNKASRGDVIPVELFQILKMMLLKCYTTCVSKLENSVVTTGVEKVSFHSNSKQGQCQRMFKLSCVCVS